MLEALREQIRTRDWRANWPGSGPPVDFRERDLRSLDWQWEREGARVLPVIRGVLADEAGAFWVERVDHLDAVTYRQRWFNDRRPDGSRWDMFDAEGRFLATVTLPPLFVPMDLAADRVTGVQRDELDIERVATYRVRRMR